MPLWMWVVAAVAVAGFVWLMLWLSRWKDPSWTDEKQKGSRYGWSKRGSGDPG